MARKKTHEEFIRELKEKQPNIELLNEYNLNSIKVNCRCKLDNFEWSALPNQVLNSGCKVCNGAFKTTEIFIRELSLVNDKVEVISDYKGTNKPIECRCLICREKYTTTPSVLLQGCIHWKCAMKQNGKNNQKTHQEFVDEIENTYHGEYVVVGKYTKAKDKIKMKHLKCGYEWDVIADTILHKKSSCPQCAGLKRLTNNEYIEALKNVTDTIVSLEEYINSETKIKHKCLVCNHEWNVRPYSIIGKYRRGCPMCKGGTNTVVIGINDMWTTNPEMAKLLADSNDGYKYMQGSNSKVCFRCKDCGEITKPIAISKVKSRGFSCKRCSLDMSLPNRIMYNLLSELNVDFEDEVIFNWCKFDIGNKTQKGIYDFYFEINDKKYIVEMDGYFHKNDNNMNGQSKEKSGYIDKQKDILAYQNNIEVIRIDCIPSTVNVIKNGIINSRLSELFNFDDLDWNKCFYKSANSKIKDTWSLFNEGLTVKQLSIKFNLDIATIMKYLDYGTELGECNYLHEGNIRKIVCINDGNTINGLNEASRQYKVSSCSIQRNCNGENAYAGYEVDTNIPLVFCDYKDYILLSDIDKLNLICDSIFKAYPNMLICLNNKKIFRNQIEAKKYCGSSSISSHLSNPNKYKTAGSDPISGERLTWMKLLNYKSNCENSVAFIM